MTDTDAAPIAPIDKDALKAKYRRERDKRLRPDGNDQYVRLAGQLAHYLDDPYTPITERPPVTDDVTVAFIGGGFAGLVTGARLKEAGVDDVRIIEKGGDFGGTWYWNRYPGRAVRHRLVRLHAAARRDGPHAVREVRPRAGDPRALPADREALRPLRPGAVPHGGHRARMGRLRGRGGSCGPIVVTSSPPASSAWAPARCTSRSCPASPDLESFRGHSFHTSRWDYDYTGGDPSGAPMDRLADKRVGIIGTGATAVQCVPHLAVAAQELYVFQRTPSSVDVRANEPTDPEWFAEMASAGWQQRWLENFTANQAGGFAEEDLVKDGWTDLARRIRSRIMALPAEDMTPEKMMGAFEDSDFEKMEEIRARVDSIVHDAETAQRLKAWYRQLCKRPCFHDTYLQAFNEPGTYLVDTDGQGVERITETGVVAAGRHYELDCIIYASGFEVGTEYTRRAGYDPVGRDGRRLSEYWVDGMRTLHGIHVHGFPNLFIVQPTQGANLISNVPHNLTESARTIATIVRHALDEGADVVEVTKPAEDAWIELLLTGPGSLIGSPDCTPGYYNNEGQDRGPAAKLFVGYPHGASAFFQYLDGWRRSGEFDGLTFRRAPAVGDSVDGRSVDDHDAAVTVDGEPGAVDDGA